MDFPSIFKKNRRQINKDNQEQGKIGEERIKAKYERDGYEVTRTGKGHDYKATRRNLLTGKKESRYIEVKTGNSQLSPLQKKKRRQFGNRYVEERVDTGLLGIGSTTVRGTPSSRKKPYSGFGIGLGPEPKRKRPKKPYSGFGIGL